MVVVSTVEQVETLVAGPHNPLGVGTFQGVKFGRGVLGKTAPLIGALIVAVGLVALAIATIDPYVAAALISAMIIVVSAYVAVAFWYGVKHPNQALLEGAELLQAKELDLKVSDPKLLDLSPDELVNDAPPLGMRAGGTRNE